MAAPKSTPKDAQVMVAILKDMGVTEFEPRVVNLMLEFTYRYVTGILDDARVYSIHAKKNTIDSDDVKLSVQCRMDHSFSSPPPRDFLLEIARQKNQLPLPLIKPYTGPRLPPDRFCLTAPNYRLKSLGKKLTAGRITLPRISVGSVATTRTTPLTVASGGLSGISVAAKVGTPVSLGQRITLQLPSTTTTVKPGVRLMEEQDKTDSWTNIKGMKARQYIVSNSVQQAGSVTPGVQSLLINAPTLVGPGKNILITTSSTAQQPPEPSTLKRKREEDDEDFDAS
uniref:transcription initiation factor TFIID subunit 9-like isoform X1 n=1 Tax=Myxine glutinosa TaxID=7769 RepID=UPI00358F9E8D